MANESNRYGDVLAELDAITAPAEAEPVVASFVLTPVAADMIADADKTASDGLSPALLATMKEASAAYREDARANGRTAQRFAERDRWRAEEGRETYNLERTIERKTDRMKDGGTTRAYGVPDSPEKRERRNGQVAANMRTYRARQRAGMTPEEIAADLAKKAAQKKERRAAKRVAKVAAEKAEREAQAIF